MRTYVGLAAAGVVITAILGVVGWILVPARAVSWMLVIGFLPLLWAFLESATKGSTEAARAILHVHRMMIAALALIIAVDIGEDLAIHVGLLGPDAELVSQRFNGMLRGALFAIWGNHLPKLMSPWSLEREPFDWQGVHRFVGRLAVVAGLGLVLVWSTLPSRDADRAADLITVVACVLAVGAKLRSVARYSTRERESAHR